MDQSVTVPALPMPLHWQSPPLGWRVADGGALTITAGARSDLFVDPQGTAAALNAPCLVGRPTGDFLLRARVTVDFAATYDAGVLLLWEHERVWAKLCFEYSPQRQPMVVSVVTRGVSDDCNSFEVDGHQVWLRVARLGPAFAFHASTDGSFWQLVRYFALDAGVGARAGAAPAVGFLAQSPTGEGCSVTFADIGFRPERLRDLRSGQ